jgi:predicted membrane metal-binding protein
LLCFALLCFALLCFALLCFALLCFALLCFALLRFALLCFALLHFTFSHSQHWWVVRRLDVKVVIAGVEYTFVELDGIEAAPRLMTLGQVQGAIRTVLEKEEGCVRGAVYQVTPGEVYTASPNVGERDLVQCEFYVNTPLPDTE